MTDFGTRYVVDTNTLTQLGKRRRDSPFFKENVVIPEEVLREARGFRDYRSLKLQVYPTTTGVLELLITIMATLSSDDRKLVDLYANRGGADPVVIACALDAKAQATGQLFQPEWLVVTGDAALRDKALEFSLKVLSNAEFSHILDGETTGGSRRDQLPGKPW